MKDSHHQITVPTTTHIEHCTVPCRRSFAETKAALEAAVPLLDRTYQRHLDAGDLAAAGEALRMLPLLNRFGAQPRNFGPILEATAATTAQEGDDRHRGCGSSSMMTTKEALQYEIGNPHKAAQMLRLRGQTAVYAPIRVALLRGDVLSPTEKGVGEGVAVVDRVWFEYDRPSSTLGNSGIMEVDEIAEGLDKALHEILVKAAGLESEAKPSL
ncbi:hypothetical protein PG990_011927 [Apiospora arundinis]